LESQAASVLAANGNAGLAGGFNPQQAHGAPEKQNDKSGQAPGSEKVVPLSSTPERNDEEVLIMEDLFY